MVLHFHVWFPEKNIFMAGFTALSCFWCCRVARLSWYDSPWADVLMQIIHVGSCSGRLKQAIESNISHRAAAQSSYAKLLVVSLNQLTSWIDATSTLNWCTCYGFYCLSRKVEASDARHWIDWRVAQFHLKQLIRMTEAPSIACFIWYSHLICLMNPDWAASSILFSSPTKTQSKYVSKSWDIIWLGFAF